MAFKIRQPFLLLISLLQQVSWRQIGWTCLIVASLLSVAVPAWAISNPIQRGTSQGYLNPAVGKGNLGNEVLYYIIVDRFFDGDKGNNIPTYAFPISEAQPAEERAYNEMNRLLLEHSYDPTHRFIGLYWGGDLRGVIEKLDYLQDLGVTKIVLSPIQDNANGLVYYPQAKGYLYYQRSDEVPTDNLYAHASTAFHGYWTKDWYEIDEHFRAPQDETTDRFQIFRQLLNEAADRDIGIILDLTLNHTSPFPYYRLPPQYKDNSIGFWFVDNGSVFQHGYRVATYWDPTSGQLDAQNWFHSFWPIDFNRPTPQMIEEGTLPGGLPDLNQDNPEVEDYLLNAARFWLTFNQDYHPIAGFRLDAVKHVNIKFWQKFEEMALSINPSTILIGEFFSGGYRNADSVQWVDQTKAYTQFDFNLSMPARNFFAKAREWDGRTFILREAVSGREGSFYTMPWVQRGLHKLLDPAETLEIPREALDTIPDEDAKAWVTFIENHDEPRMLTRFPDMTEAGYASLIRFIFTSRGVPMLMFGVETGLAVPYHLEHSGLFGIGGDPFNRPMMIWPDEAGWNEHLFQVTRSMAHLRQRYPVLRYGKTRFLFPRNSDRSQDIFMLREPESCDPHDLCTRILYAYSTSGGEYLVSLENIDTSTVRYQEDIEAQAQTQVTDGLIPIKLKPEQSKVLVLKAAPTSTNLAAAAVQSYG